MPIEVPVLDYLLLKIKMKIKRYKSKGYTARHVCEFLEIRKQTLRYWKGVLYPCGREKNYNAFEVLLLRIVKEFVLWKRVPVSVFEGFDWEIFIKDVSALPISNLRDKTFIIDPITKTLNLSLSQNNPAKKTRTQHDLELYDIVDEHIDSLIYFGVNN